MTQRDEFEAWATKEGIHLNRIINQPDDYAYLSTLSAWSAWQAAQPPAGYRLVPVEPTEAMDMAGIRVRWSRKEHGVDDIYKAMLEAAPATKEQTHG